MFSYFAICAGQKRISKYKLVGLFVSWTAIFHLLVWYTWAKCLILSHLHAKHLSPSCGDMIICLFHCMWTDDRFLAILKNFMEPFRLPCVLNTLVINLLSYNILVIKHKLSITWPLTEVNFFHFTLGSLCLHSLNIGPMYFINARSTNFFLLSPGAMLITLMVRQGLSVSTPKV